MDADGTLFDYDRAEGAALCATAVELLGVYEPDWLERYRQINSAMWQALERGEVERQALRSERFARWFAAIGHATEPERFGVRYLQNLGQRADLLPGAEEIVRTLYGRIGLALITNGFSEVQRSRLARSPLSAFLRPVVISEEVGAAKPEPAIFDAAFAAMGWPAKQRVLIVGDSLSSDMKGGLDYGLDTCWFASQGGTISDAMPLTYQISDLRQLAGIVTGAT